MGRPVYKRVVFWVPLVLIVVVTAIYVSLNALAAWGTRRELAAKLPDYASGFSKVRITLFPPGYDVYDLAVREKPVRSDETPMFRARRIEVRWGWGELVHLHFIRRVKVWDAKLTLELERELVHKAKKKLPVAREARAKLEAMPPFHLERLAVEDSEVLLIDHRDPGHPRIWLHDLAATVENVASRAKKTGGRPVLVTARGVLQHTGHLDLFLTADPLDTKLSFAGELRLRGLEMADLYLLVKDKTGMKVPSGKFDLFASFTCDKGHLTGGIKPVLSNAHVEAAQKGLGAKLKAALADAALDIFSDRVPGRKAVATIIPIEGRLDKPSAQLWPTVLAVLRNAFVEGLSSSLQSVPPPEAKKKEGVLTQARRTLSKGHHPPVKAEPNKK